MLAVCLVDARALGIDAAVMAPASGERWCVLRSTPLLRSGRAVAREPLPGRLFGRSFVSGTPFRLDPTAELAAYRIIQEALTNARRPTPGRAPRTQRNPPPDQRIRPPAPPTRHVGHPPTHRTDPPRDGGIAAPRRGPLQPRDRSEAGGHRGSRKDPRQPHPAKTRSTR